MAKDSGVLVDLDPFVEATKIVSAAIALSLESADGLTLPQLRALGILERRGTLNVSAIAEGLAVNPSNASRTCDQLVDRGLVDRAVDPDDRRSVALTLSPEGRRVFSAMMRHRRAVLAGVVAHMSQGDQEALMVGIRAFTEAAARLSDSGELLSDGDGHLLRWLG